MSYPKNKASRKWKEEAEELRERLAVIVIFLELPKWVTTKVGKRVKQKPKETMREARRLLGAPAFFMALVASDSIRGDVVYTIKSRR